MGRFNFNDPASDCLGKREYLPHGATADDKWRIEYLRSNVTGERHLCCRDADPAIANVMARTHQSCPDCRMQRSEELGRLLQIHAWQSERRECRVDFRHLRSTEFIAQFADQIKQVP